MSEQRNSSSSSDELSTQQLHSARGLGSGTMLASRFRINKQLGAGAQACVYAAHDTLLDIDVALKVIQGAATDPVSMQSLRNEVLLARKLQHPHIIRVHDVFADEHCAFFTMEYVDGTALHERLLRPVSQTQYQRWAKDLLDALNTCHQAGIKHGDIKPDNILITHDDSLQLIDFGIGHAQGQETQLSGHQYYSAPEILHSGTATDTSDTYSAGKVLDDILQAVVVSGFSISDKRWFRRQRQFIQSLTQANPLKRPGLVDALNTLDRTSSSRRFLSLTVLPIAVVLLGVVFFLSDLVNRGPDIPEKTLQIGILHDPSFPLLGTMSDMLRYPLLTEPGIALIDQQQSQRMIENLALAPWENADDRADIAAALGADLIMQLEAVPTDTHAYLLRGKVLLMPANAVVLDVTHAVSAQNLSEDVQVFGEKLLAALYSRLDVESTPPDLRYLSVLDDDAQSETGNTTQAAIAAMQEQYPDYPGSWLAGARLALEKGNVLGAQEQLEVLFAMAPESEYWHLQGQLLRAQLNDDLALAQQAIEQLIRQFPDRADLLAMRADIHLWANQSNEAIADYRQALALSPNNGQWWFELARLEIINGNIEHAIDAPLTQALVAFRKVGDQAGEGLVLNAFGVAHLRLADYQVAQRYFEDALKLRDAQSQPSARATTLANLANVAAINGDFPLAESSLNEAYALLESIGDTQQQAHVLDTLGFLYEERGQYQQALGYYKRGLDMRIQSDDRAKQAESMSNVAYMHFLTGDFSLAEIYWQQAMTQFERLSDQAHLLRTRQNLAQLKLVKGDNNAAKRHLSEVADALSEEQTQERMYNRMLLSFLHFNTGKLNEARAHIQHARQLADDTGDARALIEIDLWQAQMCLKIADWDCLASKLEALRPQITEEMLEPYAVLLWLDTAHQDQAGLLTEQAFAKFEAHLKSLTIPLVTELKLLLDTQERFAHRLDKTLMPRLQKKVAPRFYQAHLHWLYLKALQGEETEALVQQLNAHPEHWRNHLYYGALEGDTYQQRQQALTEDWLLQLSEQQVRQYRQAYLER